MDELANILANHSQFPIAWIQKLCMWGNSQRCEETDDEFKRLVKFFKNKNFNYRLTVREFFSSAWRAVITYAAPWKPALMPLKQPTILKA